MVILLSNPPHTETLIRQIREHNPNQRFTGYFEIINPALVEGVPFVAQFQVADSFAAKFKKMYGAPPLSRAAQAYDIIRLVAISTTQFRHKPHVEDLLNVISSPLFSRDGAAGPLLINKQKVIENICVWKVAKDNQFTRYDAMHPNS